MIACAGHTSPAPAVVAVLPRLVGSGTLVRGEVVIASAGDGGTPAPKKSMTNAPDE